MANLTTKRNSPVSPAASKAAEILEAAAELFLEKGFEATTIDDVAARAQASKPTVYRHFDDKQALFAAFIRRQCDLHRCQLFAFDPSGDDIRADLTRIARQYVDLIFSPASIAIFRVSIAEAHRFPDLGRAFYEAGPAAGARRMGQVLAGAVARGQLRIDDIDAAAYEFIELCKAEHFYKVQFGIIPGIDAATRDAVARRTVATFLRAYG